MSSARHDPFHAARIANRDKLRAQVKAAYPECSEDETDAHIERLLFEQRSAGGREAARLRTAREEAAKEVLATVPQLIADAEAHVALLRKIATLDVA